MTEETWKRISLDELRRMKDAGEIQHNPNAPEGPELGEDFWANAVLVPPRSSKSVHLKLDAEVFEFFKRQGKGHITRMQDVLKAYVKAHEEKAAGTAGEKPKRRAG
ncbi:MAG TPA: BrnA antitoxin family protein [Devosia sp.]|uniref:BrnA antitoxin family protein n=1 Tax=Devosia sp. TaxID=1871048 RepID=UPI002F9203FE